MARTARTVYCLLYLVQCVLCDPRTELSADPGFKDVRLSWRLQDVEEGIPTVFRIKYCENQVWGEHHCRKKIIERRSSQGTFSHALTDLKMDTDYVIYLAKLQNKGRRSRYFQQQSKDEDTDLEDTDDVVGTEERILVKTRGFSAQARDCGPKYTEVEVQTGPGFTGRISAEGALDPSCSLQGSGQKESYILKLDHQLCGSLKNSSVSSTYVVVQETLTILTHSTRRFLVVCNFGLPDTFTVKSGLSLPYSDNISPPIGVAVPERGSRNLGLEDVLLDKNSDNIITLEDYQDIDENDPFHLWITGQHSTPPTQHVRKGKMSSTLEEVERKMAALMFSRQAAGERSFSLKSDLEKAEDSNEESGGDIAIVLVMSGAGVCVLIIVCVLFTVCRSRKKKRKEGEKTEKKNIVRRESIA